MGLLKIIGLSTLAISVFAGASLLKSNHGSKKANPILLQPTSDDFYINGKKLQVIESTNAWAYGKVDEKEYFICLPERDYFEVDFENLSKN